MARYCVLFNKCPNHRERALFAVIATMPLFQWYPQFFKRPQQIILRVFVGFFHLFSCSPLFMCKYFVYSYILEDSVVFGLWYEFTFCVFYFHVWFLWEIDILQNIGSEVSTIVPTIRHNSRTIAWSCPTAGKRLFSHREGMRIAFVF